MNPLVDIVREDIVTVCKQVDFAELEGKTLLLTGASGIVGTYFLATLARLRAMGMSIVVISVTQSPFPEYLSEFAKHVCFIRADLTDQAARRALPEADYIIHAAGYGQPGKFMLDQVKTIELNTSCTIDLFRKLRQGGKFLFVSTSEVYSGLSRPPYCEDQIGTSNTTHVRSCYIEGKRGGEAIVNAYRQLGVAAKSARLSLAYGPGTKKGDARVINSFIYRGLVEKKIALMDQGEAKRTYCYVADAVEIMWQILLKGRDPIYNVGGVSSTTIGALAKQIGTSLSVPVVFPEAGTAGMAGAPEDVALDLSKVREEFQKAAFVSLEDGVARTIAWQRALYASDSL